MRKGFGLIVLVAGLLSACGDGVPKIDDPHKPVDADGNAIKGTEFLKKYCAGKANNETCAKVSTAVSTDFSRGKMPEGY